MGPLRDARPAGFNRHNKLALSHPATTAIKVVSSAAELEESPPSFWEVLILLLVLWMFDFLSAAFLSLTLGKEAFFKGRTLRPASE